jgi:hypothetical protein
MTSERGWRKAGVNPQFGHLQLRRSEIFIATAIIYTISSVRSGISGRR